MMDQLQQLEQNKAELLKEADRLMSIKKKLYANVDIESPLSKEERELNEQIANIFSQINNIVRQKNEIKKTAMSKFIIPYYESLSATQGQIDLTKSRREHAQQMAKSYALEHKKRVTERVIESFERDSGAYHRVRALLEDIQTRNFNDVVEKFKELYPHASDDWKSALRTGLVIKAQEREGHYADNPYVFNDDLAVAIREAGLNRLSPIIDQIFAGQHYQSGGMTGEYPDLIEKAKQYLSGDICLCKLLEAVA